MTSQAQTHSGSLFSGFKISDESPFFGFFFSCSSFKQFSFVCQSGSCLLSCGKNRIDQSPVEVPVQFSAQMLTKVSVFHKEWEKQKLRKRRGRRVLISDSLTSNFGLSIELKHSVVQVFYIIISKYDDAIIKWDLSIEPNCTPRLWKLSKHSWVDHFSCYDWEWVEFSQLTGMNQVSDLKSLWFRINRVNEDRRGNIDRLTKGLDSSPSMRASIRLPWTESFSQKCRSNYGWSA